MSNSQKCYTVICYTNTLKTKIAKTHYSWKLGFIVHFSKGKHTACRTVVCASKGMLDETYYRIWALIGWCGKSKEAEVCSKMRCWQ